MIVEVTAAAGRQPGHLRSNIHTHKVHMGVRVPRLCVCRAVWSNTCPEKYGSKIRAIRLVSIAVARVAGSRPSAEARPYLM